MEKAILIVVSGLAGYFAFCPRGGKPPCPGPLAKSLFGLVVGAIAGIAYLLLFIGKRVIECCDLIAVAVIAYLFALFIYTLFLAKKEE